MFPLQTQDSIVAGLGFAAASLGHFRPGRTKFLVGLQGEGRRRMRLIARVSISIVGHLSMPGQELIMALQPTNQWRLATTEVLPTY